MANRTVWLNLPGETPFASGVVTSQFGKDISAATFEVAFGRRDASAPCTAWVTATIDAVLKPDGSKVRVKVQLGAGGVTLSPGVYRMWSRVLSDSTTSQVADDLLTIAA